MTVDVTTCADADKATDAVSVLVASGSPPLHSRFRRHACRALFACLAAVAAAAPAPARPVVPDQQTIAFVDVHVLPMDRPGVLHNHSVLVDGGRIVAVAPSLEIHEGARVVDGKGRAWLLPGLADMHNHAHAPQDQELLLALGITTTLHMGEAPNSFVGRMRHAVANGESVGPRILAALAVDGSPRYGHLVVADAGGAARFQEWLRLHQGLQHAIRAGFRGVGQGGA